MLGTELSGVELLTQLNLRGLLHKLDLYILSRFALGSAVKEERVFNNRVRVFRVSSRRLGRISKKFID